MKFCLVGVGNFGKNYIKTVSSLKSSNIVSLCSQNQSKFEALSEEFKVAKWFNNYKDAILYGNSDTVIIATHPNSHFEIAKFALENSKHVICEKPCMFSEEEFLIIEDIIKTKNLIFFTNYINLFQPIIKEIKDLIKNNHQWNEIKIINCGNGPIRKNYTDLWDYGSHIFSIILSLFNKDDILVDSVKLNEDGNHEILLKINNHKIHSIFGNKSKYRINSIYLKKIDEIIQWVDDRTNEPLKIMIEHFSQNELKSNLILSKNINSILKNIS